MNQAFAQSGYVARTQFLEEDAEPYTLVLDGSEETESMATWNLVEVSKPTLLWPYYDPALTSGIGRMGSLRISYSKTRPKTIASGFPDRSRVFPSAARGACWLWHPGKWYVRCQVSDETFGAFKLGFQAIPGIDAQIMTAFLFDRKPQFAETIRYDPANLTPGTVILTTEEILDGTVAVEVQARQSNMQFAWQQHDGTNFFRLVANVDKRFEGTTLPLADLFAVSRPGQNDVCTVTKYRVSPI